jgi:hypothetical protein
MELSRFTWPWIQVSDYRRFHPNNLEISLCKVRLKTARILRATQNYHAFPGIGETPRQEARALPQDTFHPARGGPIVWQVATEKVISTSRRNLMY